MISDPNDLNANSNADGDTLSVSTQAPGPPAAGEDAFAAYLKARKVNPEVVRAYSVARQFGLSHVYVRTELAREGIPGVKVRQRRTEPAAGSTLGLMILLAATLAGCGAPPSPAMASRVAAVSVSTPAPLLDSAAPATPPEVRFPLAPGTLTTSPCRTVDGADLAALSPSLAGLTGQVVKDAQITRVTCVWAVNDGHQGAGLTSWSASNALTALYAQYQTAPDPSVRTAEVVSYPALVKYTPAASPGTPNFCDYDVGISNTVVFQAFYGIGGVPTTEDQVCQRARTLARYVINDLGGGDLWTSLFTPHPHL